MEQLKKCSGCKETKLLSEFNKHKTLKYKRQDYCRECNKIRACKRLDEYYKGNYIYSFLDDEYNILYIGSTNNIYERMTEHKHIGKLSEYEDTIKRVILYKVNDDFNKYKLRFIEQEFIYTFKPKLNTSLSYPKKGLSLDESIEVRGRFEEVLLNNKYIDITDNFLKDVSRAFKEMQSI